LRQDLNFDDLEDISLTHSKHNKGYLHGAAILAGAVAIVKVLGAIYRIPVGNILGDVGFSTFQSAHAIYAFLLTLSTAGLPVALSKMISTSHALGRGAQVKRTFRIGRNTFFLLGVVSFLIMALFSRQLAYLNNAPTAAVAILALSPAMLFVCLISAYRGYFQGFSNMIPTSISQIIEAVARLFLGLGLAWYLSRTIGDDAITVAGAIFGITVGTAIATIYLFLYKKRMDRTLTLDDRDSPDPNRQIFRNLLHIAVPLSLGASFMALIIIVDNAIILGRLQSALGLCYDQARSLHGTYGFTTSQFNLPSSFIIPITIALIPAISAFLARGDKTSAQKAAESGIRVTCLLAMPAGAGLTVLAGPIMYVLYYGRFAPQGPGLMAWMGIAAFFLCFFQATNCVLQAYGFQRYTLYTLPVGGVVKIVLNWFLLGDPRISIYGAAISTVACYVVISVMNVILVKRKIPDSPSFRKILLRPMLCTAVMAFTAWASYGLISRFISGLLSDMPARLPIAIALFGSIGAAMVVYLVLIIALRALTLEDMQMLPKGEKLAKILRIR